MELLMLRSLTLKKKKKIPFIQNCILNSLEEWDFLCKFIRRFNETYEPFGFCEEELAKATLNGGENGMKPQAEAQGR